MVKALSVRRGTLHDKESQKGITPSELHNRGMLGAQHALDPLTTVKACVNNAGIALIQHGWHPMSFITISGEIDSRAIEKSSKVGFALALKP
ncbi:unnamed protein product [Brassica oleracea]|uniref:(rape) hypothetical protein n=1 Tax=Brassica napus TaxID=3708 RepID=A0A816QTF8_BRANA|nr:unnamed protein product [Brassica napus]